jgi:hypothetical protein
MNARRFFFSWVSFNSAERVPTFAPSRISMTIMMPYYTAVAAFLSYLSLAAATELRSQCNESYLASILPSGSSTAEAAKIPAAGGSGQGAADIRISL